MVVWFVICLGLSPAGFVFRGTLKVYHADRLRSVRLVTDGGQDIMVSCVYEGFGKIVGQEGGGGGSYQFAGLWSYRNDWDARLMHVCARYYEVETGRWVQKDPWLGIVINPLTLNQYLYCLNNPTNAIDPYGNNPLALLFLLGGCLFLAGCQGCGESIPVHSAPVGTVIP